MELDGHGGDDDVGGEEGDDDNDNNHHTLQAQAMLKKDVLLTGELPQTFPCPIGAHSFFFSIVLCGKLACHVQNKLEFCQSTTGDRALRASSKVPDSLFVLSSKV